MGYMTDGLTFRVLRDANVKRLPLFKTKQGKWAHAELDGSDWSPASWLQAVIGELGEYANVRKKVERGDFTLDEARPKLIQELADVVIYIDLLAFRLGIDLGQAVIMTWNNKAKELGIPMVIDAEDWHFTRELTGSERARLEGKTGVSVRPAGDTTNKIVPCPKCCEEGESLVNETELTCPFCGHQWTHDPTMTAAQVRIRTLLEGISHNTSENPRSDAEEVLNLMRTSGAL